MLEDNKAVLTTFLKAVGCGDVEALKATLHPDVIISATGTSFMAGDRDYAMVVGTATTIGEITENGIEFELISMTAEDDRAVAEFQGRSTLINGTPYNNSYVFIATFRDGRIFRMKEYFCSKLLEDALGPVIAERANSR